MEDISITDMENMEKTNRKGNRLLNMSDDNIGTGGLDLTIEAESERLFFRQMLFRDISELNKMLQDADVMYAWEHAFTDDEVQSWLDRRISSYQNGRYDYLLAVQKTTGDVIGQIGLLDEEIEGEHYAGLGYILKKEYWHQGYATEGAEAMLEYAFSKLGMREVIATIRPENYPSRKVAERIGMKEEGIFIKKYKGKEMPHLIYRIKRKENKIV